MLNNKLIVILGPTASGKTDLSVKLALRLRSEQAKKKFKIKGVEIVSADSRQVYKGLNIGSGKITKKEMQGILHHLLDVANPKRKFTVAQYQKLAIKEIKKIQKKGKIPFLVGGTGFYIQSVVDGIILPEVKPNYKLRKELSKKTVKELFNILKKLDPKRSKTIDAKNAVRLIRAIEIIKSTKKPIQKIISKPEFEVLEIGIKKSPEELKKLIHKRLEKRLKQPARAGGGMIKEVINLHKNGLSFKRLEELGLEYRYITQYLQEKLSYEEMINILEKESWHYAKRQMTWFSAHGGSLPTGQAGASGVKKDKKIHWIRTYREILTTIDKFINK